ncbi:hypothetical protein OUZ56_000763 [Daphnia magna]|uniref:Uncharacterized protein n=1 Tax=Daphnia magna TaxID=35525 RepID=A0ABR0A0P7_9CRUS|nr:hypothetical protein OUZ56_000763 [Daphnia magna]
MVEFSSEYTQELHNKDPKKLLFMRAYGRNSSTQTHEIDDSREKSCAGNMTLGDLQHISSYVLIEPLTYTDRSLLRTPVYIDMPKRLIASGGSNICVSPVRASNNKASVLYLSPNIYMDIFLFESREGRGYWVCTDEHCGTPVDTASTRLHKGLCLRWIPATKGKRKGEKQSRLMNDAGSGGYEHVL